MHKNRKEERRMETFMESLCLWPDTALKEEEDSDYKLMKVNQFLKQLAWNLKWPLWDFW